LRLFVEPRLELNEGVGTLVRWVCAMAAISGARCLGGDFLSLSERLVLVKLRLMSSRGLEGSSGSSWNMSSMSCLNRRGGTR
jgi:hypothetical protein